MTLNDYQRKAAEFLLGRFINMSQEELLQYCALGLCEEAGEVAGKVKKAIRDANGHYDLQRIEAIILELGDVLWYLAMAANVLECSLGTVAECNIEKLTSRLERGKLNGEGDNR